MSFYTLREMKGMNIEMEDKRYKVLIADDEYWTREKLCRMIEWNRYSLECIKPAENGEEVLLRIKEERPDILITDINMPFVNGVELLEIIKEKYPNIVAFVVSGYDDFEYVKGTFMSGAINYLMKPVTKIDLVNAIVKALEIISERENEKLRLLKAASLIQDSEYSQLINNEAISAISGIPVNGSTAISGKSFVLLKIHNLSGLIKQNNYDMNLFSYNTKKEIRRLMGDENIIVFNHIYRANEFIMIADKSSKEMAELAEKVKTYLSVQASSCLTFVISSCSCTIENFHMAYVETIALLMTRDYCKKDEIITIDSKKDKTEQEKVKSRFSSVMDNRLRNYLMSGNIKAAKQVALEETKLCDCEQDHWSYLEVRQTVKQIVNIFTDFIIQADASKSYEDAIVTSNLAEAADKAVESLDSNAVCNAIMDMAEYLEPKCREVPTDSVKGIIQKAVTYIDKNYFKEMTLDFFAAKYNVESSYFSRMFRQETGENLVIYITKKRLDAAKEYIKKDNVSLAEVAFMTGYDDYTYFSRVFKKNIGMSPREYKNRC